MAAEKHALLSASSAARWMNCPGSARLTAGMPESTSEYAEAGRLAHAIGELKLRKRLVTGSGIGAKKFKTAMEKFQADALYDPEMEHTTDAYVEYVEQLYMGYPAAPHIAVEKKVDFSDFVPEGFGTADCILIGNGVLDVVDYKHGKGVPVAAEDNAQMKLYGLGALMQYQQFYTVDTLRLHIFQPRISEPQSWEISRDALMDWAMRELRPVAKEAFDGSETFQAGDWCRFCKAKAKCRAQADTYTAMEDFGYKDPHLLSNEELGQVLVIGGQLKKWVDALEEHCLTAALAGERIPGWKVVEGRRVRSFDNADAAFADLVAAGIEEALLYERRPLTLAQAEKVVGKTKFEELIGNHIVTPTGKPALAPESDKRPAFSTVAEDFGQS